MLLKKYNKHGYINTGLTSQFFTIMCVLDVSSSLVSLFTPVSILALPYGCDIEGMTSGIYSLLCSDVCYVNLVISEGLTCSWASIPTPTVLPGTTLFSHLFSLKAERKTTHSASSEVDRKKRVCERSALLQSTPVQPPVWFFPHGEVPLAVSFVLILCGVVAV